MLRIGKILTLSAQTLIGVVMLVAIGFRANAWWQETEEAAALAPANGRFVETELGRIHVSIWGAENAKTVVMTHGMAAWGGLWEETAEALQAEGYRIVAVDMPPFGFSDREDTDFSTSRQAQRLAALETALDLRDYFLVGHSYGGGIALEAALLNPERIRGLVLVCPVVGLEPENVIEAGPKQPGMVQMVLGNRTISEALVSASITNPWATAFLTKRFMHRKDALTQRHVDLLQRPMRLEGNTHHMVGWLGQFLAGDAGAVSRKRSIVSQVKVPVSLIWGERDTVTPIAQGEDLAGVLPVQRFSRLENTGHMPQLEAPDEFSRTLVATLNDFAAVEPTGVRGPRLRPSLPVLR